MTELKVTNETSSLGNAPLVFISHDSRDADLAEAFSKLLKSVSAGMLKSFRSSDKKGTEGIEFGDEWFKSLMVKINTASDVVCLLTERSLDRPWILYEAGVAKGKLDTPVHGVALGVALSKVSTGPFYQFQNSDDSEEALTKLVLQLCRRVPNLEPDKDVVTAQVNAFKKKVEEVLKKLNNPKKEEQKEQTDASAVAKVLEEMKLLVRDLTVRIESRIIENPERMKSRKFRRFHPMMIEEMAHMVGRGPNDPVVLLIIISFFRDDFPWLYEIGLDTYRSIKNGNEIETLECIRQFRNLLEFTMRGPFFEEMFMHSKEGHMMYRELPSIIDHYLERYESNIKKTSTRKKIKEAKEE